MHAYRSIATELRKLVCDSEKKKDVSLLPQCFPGIMFHPLAGDQSKLDPNTALYIGSQIQTLDNGKAHIPRLFNEFTTLLTHADWLEQKIFNPKITLRDFIRSVADKEAAHADKDGNFTLTLAHSVTIGHLTLVPQTVVAIARYLTYSIGVRLVISDENLQRIIRENYKANGPSIAVLNLNQLCNSGDLRPVLTFVSSSDSANLANNNSANHAKLLDLLNQVNWESMYVLLVQDLDSTSSSTYGLLYSTLQSG